MSFYRENDSGRNKGAGWTRNRKKFASGVPVLFPFGRKEEREETLLDDPEETGKDGKPAKEPAEAGADLTPAEEAAEAGVEQTPAGEAAEAGADLTPAEEAAEAGAEQTPAEEAVETGADLTPAEEAAETGAEQTPAAEPENTADGVFVPDISGGGSPAAEKLPVTEQIRSRLTKERVNTIRMVIRTVVAGSFAILFLMPIFLTITNSFMTSQEISANYGVIFAKKDGVRVFISQTVNLKFIPDIISFGQYFKVLFLSPEYLMKFWNSFFYVIPIVLFQLAVASLASYGFARYRGRVKEIIFFSYIILMLMPYQVTLVPNYLVSNWLKIIDTRWAIWLPGFFSPFAVYMLTKYMRRIPSSIYEAAEIDGAGEWQIFTDICLPNCRGGLVSIAILIFIDYWNMVEQPLILLSDDQLHPLSVFLSRINSGEISLAFAVAVIYMVLPMMVFLYGEDYLVEGIIYQGGIKE